MSDIPNYYIGNIGEDARNGGHRGWVVGSFMEDDTIRKNNEVEILYWEFPPGPTGHPTKTSAIIEVTIVMEGSIAGEIDGKKIVLKKGEYIVIKPGTVNNIAQNALEHVIGLTIKAPSDPSAKKLVRQYARVSLE